MPARRSRPRSRLLLYSPSVFAWGGLAHETICEIAFLELNDTARQRVIALIQQDEEFRTFRASCNWPDRPPRKRAPEHFMAIAPLPLPPGAQARALLHHVLEHGDVVGRDTVGRTIVQLAVDDRVLETLMTFYADAAELEPEPDEEEDGRPAVVELVRAKMVERRRALASARD
jgi:hypothetical protein